MPLELDIAGIMSRLPHRYPFLLIDKVLELVPEESIVALKNVSVNEPFFTGHFPGKPIMPGVLVIEAMAQAAALFTFYDERGNSKDFSNTGYYLVGVDDARFRKPVVPGDQLILKVKALRISKSICKYEAQALVDDQEVASAKLLCAIRLSE